MKSLWITDPWKTLDHPKDTSLRLIEEGLAMKQKHFWCDVKSIHWDGSRVRLESQAVREVRPGRGITSLDAGPVEMKSPRDFDRILYRVDPPVDLAYLHPLQMLLLDSKGPKKPEIINAPQALLTANEKLEAAWLGDLMPDSVISCRWEDLKKYGSGEGVTVLKPLHYAQGLGIELLDWKRNPEGAFISLERATDSFNRPVLLQRYLEGIHDGETRLWFDRGKLLAAVQKRPREGEFKVNMDQGGTVREARLSPRERKAVPKIGRRLQARGVRWAAIDLIDGFITDYNITSPGLLVEIEGLLGENLARKLMRGF